MILRIIGVFVVIAVLFSYIPVGAMGSCSEEDHTEDMRMGCGYIFHCPFTDGGNSPGPLSLHLNGRFVLVLSLLKIGEYPRSVFHPPEDGINNSNSRG